MAAELTRGGLSRSLPGISWRDIQPTEPCVELGSNWTVKESSRAARRAVPGPNIALPRPAAPLAPGMREDEGLDGTIAEMQSELRDLWRCSPMNRYYLPISGLPPLGPDPRLRFAGKPPSCHPEKSVSRVDRIIRRWDALPRPRSELPREDLEEIAARQRAFEEQLRAFRQQRRLVVAQAERAEAAECAHWRSPAPTPGAPPARRAPARRGTAPAPSWRAPKPLSAASQALLGSAEDGAPVGIPKTELGAQPGAELGAELGADPVPAG